MQVSPCQRMSSESTVAHEIQVMPKNESKVRQREPNVIPVAAVCVWGDIKTYSAEPASFDHLVRCSVVHVLCLQSLVFVC